jgi:hypothetical protein
MLPEKEVCSATPVGTSLQWMAALTHSTAVPALFAPDVVDFLASHSYPCAFPGCGQAIGTPDSGWNAPYDLAIPGLTLYRNESALVGQSHIPVIITETGWCHLSPKHNGSTTPEQLRGRYTVRAFEETWLPDKQVVAITPFLLSGEQWEFPQGQASNSLVRLTTFP